MLKFCQILCIGQEMDSITRHIDCSQRLKMVNLYQIPCNDSVVLQVKCNKVLAWAQVLKNARQTVPLQTKDSYAVEQRVLVQFSYDGRHCTPFAAFFNETAPHGL